MTTLSASDRIVVDSTGWVEYLANGPKASSFTPSIESQAVLLLPSIVVYEVHRKMYREQGKGLADVFLTHALGFGERLIPLSFELAVLASKTSLEANLPIMHAIIYATAHDCDARLITTDAHFANLPKVTLV
ncbi:MAG: type II toxin-antitoxin system VapC family toxin [Candidatus Acidiferrum sp.]